MEFLELLEAIRAEYITFYEATYEQQVKQHEGVFPEVGFNVPDTIYRDTYVFDFVLRDGEQIAALDTSMPVAVDPEALDFDYNGINVTVLGPTWEAVSFYPTPAVPEDFEGFGAWYDYWLDIEATRKPEGAVFGGVIHSAGFYDDRIDIDFGSAPVEAFTQLLDLLAVQGVTQVTITQSPKSEAQGT